MDKTLKDKAINFKGKEYVEVKERVKFFNDTYKNGSIITERLNVDGKEYFKATVCPDVDRPLRIFTGHSQASFSDTTSFVNKTSATENAETSAVGRALALMGIGVIDSIASMDEINKTTYTSPSPLKQSNTDEVVREPIDMSKSPTDVDNEFNKSTCQNCGAKIAISKQGKPYCTNRCWLPENRHFITEFKNK